MSVREVWEEHSPILKLVWDDLMANQKEFLWPSRTVGLADLVDGLLAAYCRAHDRAERYRRGYKECWALYALDPENGIEDGFGDHVLIAVCQNLDNIKLEAGNWSGDEIVWVEGIYDKKVCYRATANTTKLRLQPYEVK